MAAASQSKQLRSSPQTCSSTAHSRSLSRGLIHAPHQSPVRSVWRHPPSHMAQAATAQPQQLTAAQVAFPAEDIFLLSGHEKGSFAEDTISRRLPGILGGVLEDLGKQTEQGPQEAEQLAAAIAAVQRLQQDVAGNAVLSPVEVPPAAPPQLAAAVEATNTALSLWQQRSTTGGTPFTWLGLPWLLVECYMYVALTAALHSQPLLAARGYDPFRAQKNAALDASAASLVQVGSAVLQLVEAAEQQQQGEGGDGSREQQFHRLVEALQYALWGNKTDLSLFSVSSLDNNNFSAVQSAAGVGSTTAATTSSSSSRSSNTGPLLVDESAALWKHLAAHPDAHLHIVLDNSGLELFTDLCLAEYLLASGAAGSITLHGKVLPYFVSDTLRTDLDHLVEVCSREAAPAGLPQQLAGGWPAVRQLAARWQQHMEQGRLLYQADPFWTTPFPFWWMQQAAPALWQELAGSPLVVFKGDLNYRKLVFDGRWPPTTPFAQALGPAAGLNLLSLRTLKADTIAGLAPGQVEAVGQVDPAWQVNGKFGVVQFNLAA